jgi:vacuolar protein-sorting-associated protein 4
VYTPIPEAEARTNIVKLRVGDTHNNLSDADFDRIGEMTENSSGSDNKVFLKEALMQPLLRCRNKLNNFN